MSATVAPTTPHHKVIATLVSPARLAPFLRASHGDIVAALRLYQSNIAVSAAFYEVLHVVEVTLRNAIDVQVRQWNSTQKNPRTGLLHGPGWTLDPSRLLRRLVGAHLDEAVRRARIAVGQSGNSTRAVTHDDVVAQLSMGTWRFLLPDRDAGRQRLWDDAIRAGFPAMRRPVQELVRDVDGLYRLRNRIAHLEPLLPAGLTLPHLAAARHVLLDIDPAVERWLVSMQRVTGVVRKKA